MIPKVGANLAERRGPVDTSVKRAQLTYDLFLRMQLMEEETFK
jgi:hypothetical protein